ncbi:unnamed protein product [Somion occarium]|uniref:Uncharacterized protein n=1 Tax=Somion occarium TaxID=3059160 RepID=A0ABP1CEC0_9APHY
MEGMHSPEPWYLTIVRTQGILYVRPEKSWRPIVSLTIDGHHTHEITLGCDGQNPNLKTPFILRDLDITSHLDFKVFHKSQSKNRKKRNLVGSAYVAVGDILRRQHRPNSNLDLRLTCPPPQKRSPTIGGTRKLNTATLTIRLRTPAPLPSSSSVTAVDSAPLSHDEDEVFSDMMSDDPPGSPEHDPPAPVQLNPVNEEGSCLLRNRRKRQKLKPYCLNTSDEEPCSSSESSCYPPSPVDQQDSFPTIYDGEKNTSVDTLRRLDESEVTFVASHSEEQWKEEMVEILPRVLPQYADQMSLSGSLSLAESVVDRFAPYKELCEATADSDFEKVLGKLLTEWYVVGASLLAVAGLNAAVFGFESDAMFTIDGIAKRSIAIGSIAAGIGIVVDAWFLVAYSGTNVAKFKRLALDVYQTYFFFCLTCRLPTLCMFISACALMAFLFSVAWEAWPTAVLVMSFIAGILVSLQYLIFGVHRFVNMMVWVLKCIWWKACGLVRTPAPAPEPQSGPQMPVPQVLAPAVVRG